MKTIVVAGAGGAAGPPAVRALAEAGHRVIALDVRETGWEHPDVVGKAIDLLDLDAVRALAAELGPVDGLVHLVGGWRGGKTFAETKLADWDFLNDMLIRTLQHTTLALEFADGARVAIVSQTGVRRPSQGNAAYAAAKAASEAWTLALADSFAGTESAAVILVVKALATGEPRPGWTPVDELASKIAGLWDLPAPELNGIRLDLTV
ncbi:SDR family NAD(P)-dependent oxidoreductase [Actinocorallia populi]|uniref:SDR family NAD(P)-dependent oxidoreductase n=1 Tax=Actinocorallia populi TaxID=2079200 RepID=UPI000D09051C|nr:SDR family NAD(P)-dependent oxidoreductase [Actinocorallia populi]